MTGFAIPLNNGQAVSRAADVASSVRSLHAGRDGPRPDGYGRGRRCGLSALGWVLRYTALRQLALAAGLAQWAATLWPLCVDLFVFVATPGRSRRSSTAAAHYVRLDACGGDGRW